MVLEGPKLLRDPEAWAGVDSQQVPGEEEKKDQSVIRSGSPVAEFTNWGLEINQRGFCRIKAMFAAHRSSSVPHQEAYAGFVEMPPDLDTCNRAMFQFSPFLPHLSVFSKVRVSGSHREEDEVTKTMKGSFCQWPPGQREVQKKTKWQSGHPRSGFLPFVSCKTLDIVSIPLGPSLHNCKTGIITEPPLWSCHKG